MNEQYSDIDFKYIKRIMEFLQEEKFILIWVGSNLSTIPIEQIASVEYLGEGRLMLSITFKKIINTSREIDCVTIFADRFFELQKKVDTSII